MEHFFGFTPPHDEQPRKEGDMRFQQQDYRNVRVGSSKRDLAKFTREQLRHAVCGTRGLFGAVVMVPLIVGILNAAPQNLPSQTPKGTASGAVTTGSASPGNPGSRPDLIGHVTSGDTVPKATIFIFTAGPKVGTSTFCPSCYADCRKSAESNADGNFEIESLDPQLIFRILVVAKGFRPQFISKVDPARGPVEVELEPVDSSAITSDRSIQGQVVDREGKPIVGAVVESHGIRRKDDAGSMWGQLPGVDPLAVTDEQGQFLLSAREPFASLDVRVEAQTFANKQFNNLASGPVPHKLTLTEGVTVKGRVVWQDKPLAGVSIGMVSVDRGVENYTGNFDVGTDSEGRFALVNLPPNIDYFIYGLMDTLHKYGAIPIRKIHTGEDGAIVDAGELPVGPSQRLAGRVLCSDNEPLPSSTRLLISREQAWDSRQVKLDEEGRFDVEGIPPETISLSARVAGYHISTKNLSLDPLNSRLIGRMDQNVTNLVFLLDPGPEQRSHLDDQLPEAEWPQNKRLRGAEAPPDHSSQWLISGRVLDSQTQEPISRFRVTLGNAQPTFKRTYWDERDRVEGTNGIYVAYLNKKYAQPVLKIESEGYLPDRFTLQPESHTNLNFQLQKGTGPGGTVVLPGGEPAQAANVALLCAGDEQVNLLGKGRLQAWRHPEMLQFTEPDGGFSFQPELDMKQVVAVAKEGFKIVSIGELATNSKVTLEPWGKIKGVLHRASNLSSNEDVDIAFQGSSILSLQLHTVTDAEGRFEFDHVPPGQLQINGRNMINANSWSWDSLEKASLNPAEELNLDIHAPAKSERTTTWKEGRTMAKPARLTGPGPAGTVLLPNGKPAVDAEVALLAPGKYIALGKAAFKAYEARQEGLIVRTGNQGHFALPGMEGATAIVAINDDGYAYESLEQLKSSPQVRLQPWGRIEGTLLIGQHPGTNESVVLESGNIFYGNSELMFDLQDFQAQTDEHGRFVMTFVPPGERRIARLITTSVASQVHSAPTALIVNPGKVTDVVVGGTGRIVVGKVHIGESAIAWERVHASLHTPLPDFFKKQRTPEEQSRWFSEPAVKLAMKAYRVYPVIFSADGSFRAEEVPPGKYKFELTVMTGAPVSGPANVVGHFEKDVVVSESSGKKDPSPEDLGIIESKLEPPKQRAANDK